jgi:putative colanic acid biosynthesis acetyltransferase WcaF
MAGNKKTRLENYDNTKYSPGRNIFVLSLWYFVNVLFFINPMNPFSSLKVALLRVFGARVGMGVNIKPSVNIKYPWRLKIGDYVWIGEGVWIDNLANVAIGDNSCISQGVLLLTGSHDYTKETFDVLVGDIVLEEGVWLGAKSLVYPNVVCKSHSILGANSVAIKDLDAYSIHHGNPAVVISKRVIK